MANALPPSTLTQAETPHVEFTGKHIAIAMAAPRPDRVVMKHQESTEHMANEQSVKPDHAGGTAAVTSLSSHILPTSATMVGVCMTVLSLGRLTHAGRLGIFIDKALAADAVVFLISAVLSFLSIRIRQERRRAEDWAEELFLLGLVLSTLSAVLIAFTIDF